MQRCLFGWKYDGGRCACRICDGPCQPALCPAQEVNIAAELKSPVGELIAFTCILLHSLARPRAVARTHSGKAFPEPLLLIFDDKKMGLGGSLISQANLSLISTKTARRFLCERFFIFVLQLCIGHELRSEAEEGATDRCTLARTAANVIRHSSWRRRCRSCGLRSPIHYRTMTPRG